MFNWVIPGLLNEDVVLLLEEEKLLGPFAECSKPLIVDSIYNYIYSAAGDPKIKDLLKIAYKDKISYNEAKFNEEIISTVNLVNSYDFNTVHAGLSLDELESMRTSIKFVYNSEANVPYINPISGDIVAAIINNLLALHRVNKDISYRQFATILSKNKELFKDKPNAAARGTIFKSISKRSVELDIILNGIEFLISKKKEKLQPESWRVF